MSSIVITVSQNGEELQILRDNNEYVCIYTNHNGISTPESDSHGRQRMLETFLDEVRGSFPMYNIIKSNMKAN